MARNPEAAGAPPVSLIKATPVLLTGAGAGSVSILSMIPAMGVSFSLHIVMIAGFAFLLLTGPGKSDDGTDGSGAAALVTDDDNKNKNKDDADDKEPNLVNPLRGDDPDLPFPTNESPRKADFTINEKTRPDEAVGRETGDITPPKFVVAPPPGMENILGNGGRGGIGIGDLDAIRMAIGGDLGGRSGATKAELLKRGGGNGDTEAAVALGLVWFSKHQARDGHWAMDDFQNHIEYDKDGKETAVKCNCEGGTLHDNIAGTAFALLPFLGAGLTPDNGKREQTNDDYGKQIEKGLDYLRKNQMPDGRFAELGVGQQDNEQYSMYNHAIATICMSEAASLYPKDWVKNSAQSAINFLVKIQEPTNGGWRYGPRPQPGDSSVVGWCVMALKSGQLAGLKVDPKAFDKARHFFDSVEVSDSSTTYYGYTDKSNAPANSTLTAVGLLCRMYMGWDRKERKLVNGWRFLKTNMPDPNSPNTNLYYQYYATQVMHHMGYDEQELASTKEFRDGWTDWNKRMRDILVKRQDQGKGGRPHQQGSWTPTNDQWCNIGGRVMMTSLCMLTLEVYYRHLPLYRATQSDK